MKRLRHKLRLINTTLGKSNKPKVFHLGTAEDYDQRYHEYMDRTKAYQYLGTTESVQDLVIRTKKYLLNLRLAEWITQKQYEQLCVKADEVELAYPYYLRISNTTSTDHLRLETSHGEDLTISGQSPTTLV